MKLTFDLPIKILYEMLLNLKGLKRLVLYIENNKGLKMDP
jgi:hypothetical protein